MVWLLSVNLLHMRKIISLLMGQVSLKLTVVRFRLVCVVRLGVPGFEICYGRFQF